MKKTIISLLCSLLITTLPVNVALSQEGQAGTFADESVRDITTVVAIGAAGAVLGLSTLSFVEEPKDHLKNIVVGGAIGIIVGVGIVAYGAANKSKDLYEQTRINSDMGEFSTVMRISSAGKSSFRLPAAKEPSQLNFNFTF